MLLPTSVKRKESVERLPKRAKQINREEKQMSPLTGDVRRTFSNKWIPRLFHEIIEINFQLYRKQRKSNVLSPRSFVKDKFFIL